MSDTTIRAAKGTDAALILETWVGTYRNSPWAGVIPNNRFNEVTEDAIKQLLLRGSQIDCAVDAANPQHVVGYVVHEKTRLGEPVVHYLFVKDLYRRQGLARQLLEHAGIDPSAKFFYTFKTPFAKYFRGGRYVPAIARRKEA